MNAASGLLVLLALGLEGEIAWAQDSVAVEMSPAVSALENGSAAHPSGRSQNVAVLLSTASLVLPTVAGVILMSHSAGTNQDAVGGTLIGAGMLLGPSVGNFYGGCSKRAWTGIAIRLGVAAVAGTIMALTPEVDGPDPDILVGGAGLAVISGQALYESFTAGGCVAHDSQDH